MIKFFLVLVFFFQPTQMFAAEEKPKPTQTKQLIVIDPGHGDFDIGAKVGTLKEKNLALETAIRVKNYLHAKGYRVILTRSRDVFLPLKRRADIANDTKSSLFVSIHFNAFKTEKASGIEIYYYNHGNKERLIASKKLAQIVLDEMLATTGAINRGVRSGNFHVIRETKMPAILIEGGFITNPKEHAHLSDKNYIDKMARSIANGIEKHLKR